MENNYKKCLNCGNEEKRESSFCSKCGSKFEDKKVLKKPCIKCKKKIDVEDMYCKYCGSNQSREQFRYSLAGVILSFLLIGPLCLIQLWKSGKISRGMKIFMTFAVIVMTLLIIAGIIKMVTQTLEQYRELMNLTM